MQYVSNFTIWFNLFSFYFCIYSESIIRIIQNTAIGMILISFGFFFQKQLRCVVDYVNNYFKKQLFVSHLR